MLGGGGFIPARPPRARRHPRSSHAEQSMEAADYEVLSVRQQLFHEKVRECIVVVCRFPVGSALLGDWRTHEIDPAFLAYFKCNNVSSQDSLIVEPS